MNAIEVAKKIDAIIENTKRIKVFGENARLLAKKKYDKKIILNKYSKIIN